MVWQKILNTFPYTCCDILILRYLFLQKFHKKLLWVGHSNPGTTSEIYTHLISYQKQQAIKV